MVVSRNNSPWFLNVVLLPSKRTPFTLQKDSFCTSKRVLLKAKTSPFENEEMKSLFSDKLNQNF